MSIAINCSTSVAFVVIFLSFAWVEYELVCSAIDFYECLNIVSVINQQVGHQNFHQ